MILLIIIFLIAAAAMAPHYGYSREWGYRPSIGIVGLLVIVLLLLFLFGGVHNFTSWRI